MAAHDGVVLKFYRLCHIINYVSMKKSSERIKIFSWHIHGSYLYYLSQGPFEIYVPINDSKTEGYIGRGTTFPFGSNVHEVSAQEVRNISFDCILFQTPKNYLVDQYEILSAEQLQLPRLYLEHDPPQGVPTDTRHVVNDADVTLVHVTHFNKLMWDNGRAPAEVIDHGITIPQVHYVGKLERGIVVINNLNERGRRLGLDIFMQVRERVPLDLIGMDTEKIGGLGEILHPQLPEFIAQYRFFFNPIRYTSLGLAVLEAMMAGVPVVGLATTEMVTVIENGRSGYLHTNIEYLIERMQQLLADRTLATRIGSAGKDAVIQRFNIHRFTSNWEHLLMRVIQKEQSTSKAKIMSEILQ
jgi:glycosyltransferase involved in cell wall biosynthesis